jgi:SynChlorMet cassette radical SAM/SPASM protein ScmE
LDRIVANRMRFSILTNGWLVTDEIAARLARTGRCNAVQVSVDGPCAEVHDVCRGEGSFDHAVEGIRLLQLHRVPVTVRVTIHRFNVQYLRETAEFLLKELAVPALSTNAAGYLGSCRTHAAGLLLGTGEKQLAMEILLALRERYPGRIIATAGPMAEAVLWSRMERARSENLAGFRDGGCLTACRCPTSRLAVRADGTYVPCMMLAHMALGRINRDSLIRVWRGSEGLNRLRRREAIPLSEFGFCAGCDYIPYCTGNCPALAYTMTGEVDHPAPDACLRSFLMSGGSVVPPSTTALRPRSGHGTVHQQSA